MEKTTGRVVDSFCPDKRLPIASTTKILTALIALEQENLNEYFTVDKGAVMVEGSSMGLKVGDRASLMSLCYGMLLSSGNDAANAAAVRVAKDIPAFSELMNKKAEEIGMRNSHFITPSGLHDEEHYSTAYDMALLAREALSNPHFAAICRKSSGAVEFGNPPYKRYLKNHNRLLTEYEGCIGVKTGFTKKAGRCLVSAAERDGLTLICVTLNCPNDWEVHKTLLNRAFSSLKPTVIEADIGDITLPVVGGTKGELSLSANGYAVSYIEEKDKQKLEQSLFLPRFCYAPIKKGDKMGELAFTLGSTEVARISLAAAEDIEYKTIVKKKNIFEKIKEKFINWKT